MKSIKQQYIDLQEGKMSQSNFMRNVRMTLPQFITNVTSYNDTVRILKNKGIITEADRYAPSNYQDDDDKELPAIYRMYNTDAYVDAMDAAGDMGDDDKEYEYIDDDDEDNEKDYDADYSEPNEPFEMAEVEDETEDDEMAAILKQLEDEEDAKHTAPNIRALSEAKTKWENTSGKAMYDQFKEIDNMNSYEVMLGINFEMQKNHELSKKDAAKIVIKNLKKNPNYYTATLASGIEGYEIPSMSAKPEAWQMKYLTKDNLVDKEMGMKPVKNIAKAKASANKANKETNKAKDIDVLSLVAQTLRGVDKMQSQGEKMKTIKLRETIQRLVKEVMNENKDYSSFPEWLNAFMEEYKDEPSIINPIIENGLDKAQTDEEFYNMVKEKGKEVGKKYAGEKSFIVYGIGKNISVVAPKIKHQLYFVDFGTGLSTYGSWNSELDNMIVPSNTDQSSKIYPPGSKKD
jgi:hypothetical protein